MDTEDEKGDDEEEPGKIKDEGSSDDNSERKHTGKTTGQAKGEDDTNSEMSWWDEHVVVAPRGPSIDMADLVKVFTGVLKLQVASGKLLVVAQDLRSLSDYRAFPPDMFLLYARRRISVCRTSRISMSFVTGWTIS